MNRETIYSELSAVAADYNHSVQQQAVLESFKDPILLLRAKYASYERISELLQPYGIRVSVATVRNFCRKYQAEAKRLRSELENQPSTPVEAPTESAPEKTSPAPGQEQRPPLTTEPGKRGPRTARDQL